MGPVLSIAIPTHNRARYAIHAIRSLLELDDARIEVVVSDTSTQDDLAQWVQSDPLARDARLNYFRPTQRLDMTGNHNAALGACRGDYVCLIGDDDTVTAEAIEAAAWARERDVELIAPNVVANYVWPDFRSRYFGAGHASRLYFAREWAAARWLPGSAALEHALSRAAQGTDGMPKIYHGIVRRSLMEQIRERSGAYFHGSSPDVSGAVGLAVCCERFLIVDYPLTIPGASGGSNTGRSAMNTHKGRLDSESQTRAFVEMGWSAGVPKFFSVETVWAHAALQTLQCLVPGRIAAFNFARLMAACLELHPEYASEVARASDEARAITGQTSADLAAAIDRERRERRRTRRLQVFKRLLHPTASGGRAYVGGLPTVADAPPKLAERLRSMGVCWKDAANRLPHA